QERCDSEKSFPAVKMLNMMRKIRLVSTCVLVAHLVMAQQPGRGQAKAPPPPAPITAKPDELARIKDKTEQIDALVKELKAQHADPVLVGDVEVYARAGRMLLEIPDMFGSQAAIEHAFAVLDQGIERG